MPGFVEGYIRGGLLALVGVIVSVSVHGGGRAGWWGDGRVGSFTATKGRIEARREIRRVVGHGYAEEPRFFVEGQ